MSYYFSHNWHHMVINGSLIGVYLDGSWLVVVAGFYLELTFTNRLRMLTNAFYIKCSFYCCISSAYLVVLYHMVIHISGFTTGLHT